METNYLEQMKAKMAEWQKQFEDMRTQFASGKMDAVEAFEKQKSHLRDAITTLKANTEKATDLTEEQLTKLKARMEELQVQLALGKADGMDAFHEQKKKIEHAIESLKQEGKETYNKGFEQALQMFDHNTTAFKTGLEILKLQFALGKMDAKDNAEELKAELNTKMNEMQNMMHEGQKIMTSQMQEWNKQWQDGYEKMKNWADQWTKK
jgi:hypothetical protein